jgi:hypothetical protein
VESFSGKSFARIKISLSFHGQISGLHKFTSKKDKERKNDYNIIYGYTKIMSLIFYKQDLSKGFGKLYYKPFCIDLSYSNIHFFHAHNSPKD